MTKADLGDLVAKINAPGSYSARRFRQLATQVSHDLATGKAWGAAYSRIVIRAVLT